MTKHEFIYMLLTTVESMIKYEGLWETKCISKAVTHGKTQYTVLTTRLHSLVNTRDSECVQFLFHWHPYVQWKQAPLKSLLPLCCHHQTMLFAIQRLWFHLSESSTHTEEKRASKREIHHRVSPLPLTIHLRISVIRSLGCLMWYDILSPP